MTENIQHVGRLVTLESVITFCNKEWSAPTETFYWWLNNSMHTAQIGTDGMTVLRYCANPNITCLQCEQNLQIARLANMDL